MTTSTITTTLGRIASAATQSPIAVFYLGDRFSVDAVFADTIHTRYRIAIGDPNLLGCFDMSMNREAVARELREALDKRANRDNCPVPGVRYAGEALALSPDTMPPRFISNLAGNRA